MKIKKVVLTAVAALGLFATSAVATSSVNPVVSNAASHKVHKHAKKYKRAYNYDFIFEVVSKGHHAKYFDTKSVAKNEGNDGMDVRMTATNVRGYSVKHRVTNWGTNHKEFGREKAYTIYVSKNHKAIKDSDFTKNARRFSAYEEAHDSYDDGNAYGNVPYYWTAKGAQRISKATFNHLNKELVANHYSRY